jgi:O-antigen biosynthesis protein
VLAKQQKTIYFMRIKEKIRLFGGEVLLSAIWVSGQVLRKIGLVKYHHLLVVSLVEKVKLFDLDYYLENNPDVIESAISPIKHYVAYGDREGRSPLALFDPHYYRTKISGRTKYANSLLHYVFVGRYCGASPSPFFDVRYYLSQNKDVARTGCEPLYHYLAWGGAEGRSPNPQFDGAYYLQCNPEIAKARLNPLIHYLMAGRRDGIPIRGLVDHYTVDDTYQKFITGEFTPELWKQLKFESGKSAPVVDVVIPVYRDIKLTLLSIYSVLKSVNTTPYELIVIDDESPEPELSEILVQLSIQGFITLIKNDVNLGFVATVNRGMRLHEERDVVLVNSDAEVYNNWLDRLYEAAYKEPNTASVTPLSNNATICSYPRFLHDNPYPLETTYSSLDKMAAEANKGDTVSAPTGVGFCMYIRRDALVDVGLFDEETFGKGYGEENDWCQRAIKKGWSNKISTDTFVRHFGSASFQGEKAKRVADAMNIISRLYPDYHQSVQNFIKEDPLKLARRKLDWERLKSLSRKENVLVVCHNRGGGAERHVQEDTQVFLQEGKGVYFLRPERGQPDKVRICQPACRQLLNMPIFSLSDTSALAEALGELGITSIHSHGLVDFSAEAPSRLLELAQSMEIPLNVDIHDYKVICPRINLVDGNGKYCGEPADSACDTCLAKNGNDFGVQNIVDWRLSHHRVLRESKQIFVPDEDVAKRLSYYYKDIAFEVEPHNDIDTKTISIKHKDVLTREKLRIVVIGAISKIKGYHVLLACAKDAKKRKLPLEFIVMGFSHNDRMLERAGVKITGRYLESEAHNVLQEINAHVAWLPSTWPETYSYTLSIGFKSNMPVFAFDIGAIARRIREIDGDSRLLSLDIADNPVLINNFFYEYRQARLDSRI